MASKKAPKKKPAPRRRAIKTTATVAVLSALVEGADTIKVIAKRGKMKDDAVRQVLGRLRRKDPPQAKRINKAGFAVIAKYKITPAGLKALLAAIKEMQIET